MSTERTPTTPLEADLRALREAVCGLTFPALRDQVLLELVARRVPYRVVRRLLVMSPAERYGSADDLCAKVRLGDRRRRRTRPPWA